MLNDDTLSCYSTNATTMKKQLLLGCVVITSSFAIGQSSSSREEINPQIQKKADSAKGAKDEGTNNPESSGAHVVLLNNEVWHVKSNSRITIFQKEK